jgi:hypothetical protein
MACASTNGSSSPDGKKKETNRCSIEDAFPGYEPKRTPDTVLDYRPALGETLGTLPEARPEHLARLLDLFKKYRAFAAADPGHMEPGRAFLGESERYEASDAELFFSEIGQRTQAVVAAMDKTALKRRLIELGVTETSLTYGRVKIGHVDALGSGRFFYADPPEPVTIAFE